MDAAEKPQSLPHIIRTKLGLTRYKMAKLLDKTPAGYSGMESRSKKYSLADLLTLKDLGGYSWQEFGELVETLVEEPKE